MTSTAAALDADLAAILDARLKARAARTAFELFEGADQARIDAIVRAMARAGTDAAEELARLAVDETGYGVFEDKIVKNLYNTRVVADALLSMRTVGVLWVDEGARTTAVGCPVAVGAGNVPCFVHRSVPDITEAAVMVVTSKAFDNGTACVAEQAVVIDEPVADAYEAALEAAGCAWVDPSHHPALSALLFTERGGLRPEAVGQSAVELARRAGFSVPPSTRVLGIRLDGVGRHAPLSAEILGPVLKVYRVSDAGEGWRVCPEILAFAGEGHTLALHASDPDVIARFSALPASRILVNTPALFGGMGYSTGIDPSFVLGTGSWSGSIASDTITALHLLNIT